MPDPIDDQLLSAELRRALTAAGAEAAGDEGRRSRIVDAWIVRHPARAADFRSVLAEDDEVATRVDENLSREIDDAAAIPAAIAHYEVVRELGRGGMGVVYLARDSKLRRLVAVKVLPPTAAGQGDMLERFQREAAAVAELEHPGIVPIFEVGRHESLHYFVMQYIGGKSLAAYAASILPRPDGGEERPETIEVDVPTWRAARSPEPDAPTRGPRVVTAESLERLLGVFVQVARALDHAHEHDIIHRDVKPSNIMVDAEGDAHLLDFGLAKVVGDETMTASGKLLGTIPYMAPERLAAGRGDVDRRVDVYALGVTLFEALTGVRPFRGETQQSLMFQVVMTPAPSPKQLVPELSRDLETIVLKCLEKNPARRYASCAELAEDLERLCAHRKIEARPVGRVGRAVRWAERHKIAAAFALAAVLLALAAPAAAIWSEVSAGRARGRAADAEGRRAENVARRHRELVARLKDIRLELDALRDRVEPHENANSPSKLRLLELRNERDAIRETLPGLELAARFAWARAREMGRPPRGGLERFLAELHAEAWSRLDERRAAEIRELMKRGGYGTPPMPSGRLSLQTYPSGAQVVVRRLVDDGRGVLVEGPAPALEARSPIDDAELPCGRYVALISAEGRHEVRYPFVIEPQEHWGHPSWHGGAMAGRSWKIELPAAESFDAGAWAFVARGPYQATADRESERRSPDLTWQWEDDFVLARREATFGDYVDYFERPELQKAIEDSLRAQKARHFPRRDFRRHPALELIRMDGGRVRLEIDEAQADRPLTGLSPPDIEDFAAWLSAREGVTYELPTSRQWEKAARGVDGRIHPWGDGFRPSYTACLVGGELRWPERAGAFPTDTSPYGILDMAGNVEEWCADAPNLRESAENPWVAGGNISLADPRHFRAWAGAYYPFDGAETFLRGFRLVRTEGGR